MQGEIDRAVREVTGQRDVEIYGSGRTDAGVHAMAQVAHVEVHTTLPPETLRHRINDALPSDINVLRIDQVRHRFHARHDAIGRSYIYQVSRRRTAFAKSFVWWVREDLDIERMREAGRVFVGHHDFRSFSDDDPNEKSTEVRVERLEITRTGTSSSCTSKAVTSSGGWSGASSACWSRSAARASRLPTPRRR